MTPEFIPSMGDVLFTNTVEMPSESPSSSKGSRTRILKSKCPAKADQSKSAKTDRTDTSDENPHGSVASRLIAIAEVCELWADRDGNACVTWAASGRSRNARVEGSGFRQYLSACFYEMTGMGVNDNAMKSALCTIEAKALHSGTVHPTALRVGGLNGKIYLDLGDADWNAIEIGDRGWKLLNKDCPVRFLRRTGMQALPMPEKSPNIDSLWKYLNVATEDRVLIAGFILQCFNPSCGYFGLNLHGGAGTAKTTATFVVRTIVDPNQALTASFPRDAKELFISASAQRVLAFDNVSHLSNEESDWLCRMSTGDAYRSRTLYTDFDETILTARNPWILNGIPNVISRGDLLERGISVELHAISKHERITEAKLKSEFGADLPMILGGFLEAVSASLRNLPIVKKTYAGKLPRMAEAAEWITAGEVAMGFSEGEFLARHAVMSIKSSHESIDGDLVASKLVEMSLEQGGFTKLIGELRQDVVDALDWKDGRSRGHPLANPKAFGGYLTRITPVLLSAHGITIQKESVRSSKGWRVTLSSPKSQIES